MAFRLLCNICNVMWRVGDLPYSQSNRSRYFKIWFFFMILLYPRLEEERQVLCVCLSVRPPPVTNIFVLFFSGITDVRHFIFGVQPRLVVPPHAYQNFTLVQYSPLNRFPTFKKKILSILEMDLSFGVYWDVPVLLGSFRLSSHKKIRRSCDCSVNKKN